jgi:UDP-glucose:(heptosyl)LPS alpha-1,3-glucosyltransferase
VSKLHVAFVIMDVGPVGGMERQATEVIRGLVAAGHKVTVVARTCDLDGLKGVDFARVRTPRRPYTISFPLWVAFASLKVRRLRADVVHVNGAIVLNKADIATVHFCHHAFQASFPLSERARENWAYRVNALLVSQMTRRMESWCLRPNRATHLVAISDGVGHEIQRWFPRRASPPIVIPYGVDSERFRPSASARSRVRAELGLSDDVPLAVFVGGDWERKGLRFVIQALKSRPAWHLVVAGDGDRNAYAGLASTNGAEERVHFAGRVDPTGLYAAGDAFVFPTAYETFSLVAHEAAAAALPVLVTRVSGPDQLIDHGTSGWFITRSSNDIAGRLGELEADRALRQRMGTAAREAAAPLTWDRARGAHDALYSEVVAARRRRDPR